MANILGEKLKIISFGESHGQCIGLVIDGFPTGFKIDPEALQKEMRRRQPGQSSLVTSRKEEDKVEIFSGVFNGLTTGSPICLLIFNKDVDSSKYELIKNLPRPGHADLTAYFKYKGFNDYRGGGRFSGRITAGFVAAGALAKQLLKEKLKIEIYAYTVQIGKIKAKEVSLTEIKKNPEKNLVRCADLEAAQKMEKLILKVKKQNDSLGGIIECQILNPPIGLGEPVFNSLESELAKAIFSIPACKGIEFGLGFKVAEMKGSLNNDEFILKNGKIAARTNNAGGILGGISNGLPIVFKAVFKPTASIGQPQKTINLKTKKPEILRIEGRHDPCLVPRAVPVTEAMAALVIADLSLQTGLIRGG